MRRAEAVVAIKAKHDRASAILRNSGAQGPRISWTRWRGVITAGRYLGGPTGRWGGILRGDQRDPVGGTVLSSSRRPLSMDGHRPALAGAQNPAYRQARPPPTFRAPWTGTSGSARAEGC